MADLNFDTTTSEVQSGTGSLKLNPQSTEVVTISNGLLVPDGTKSEPAVRFTDDDNTGMYSPVNDSIAFTGHGEDTLVLTGVASSVNVLEIKPSITTEPLLLSATGTDTNIDVNIVPKGTGLLRSGGTEVSLLGHNHSGVYQPIDAQLTDIAGMTPTKGHLIVGDGTNFVSVGVGTDTQVLTADSLETPGVKWADAGGGGSSPVYPPTSLDVFDDFYAAYMGTLSNTFVFNPSGMRPSTLTGTVSMIGVVGSGETAVQNNNLGLFGVLQLYTGSTINNYAGLSSSFRFTHTELVECKMLFLSGYTGGTWTFGFGQSSGEARTFDSSSLSASITFKPNDADSTTNFICVTDGGSTSFPANGSSYERFTTSVTRELGVWYKFGIKFTPNNLGISDDWKVGLVEFFINDVKVHERANFRTDMTANAYPDYTSDGFGFFIKNSTGPSVVFVDWVRTKQRFQTRP